jgi:hypothetical protein
MTQRDTNFVASGDQTTRSAPASAGGDNIVDLVKQLATQGSHLAEQQLTLVKAEIREATGELKTAIGSMLGAAVVGIAGLGVVLMGLAYLLGDAIDKSGPCDTNRRHCHAGACLRPVQRRLQKDELDASCPRALAAHP